MQIKSIIAQKFWKQKVASVGLVLLLHIVCSIPVEAKEKIDVVLPKGKDRSIDYSRIRNDGASYYNGPRIIQKILQDFGINVSIDKLTVDSGTKFGVSNLEGLSKAIKKHGLYAIRKRLSFEQMKELAQSYTLLTTLTKSHLHFIVLSVEENGVRLFSPVLHNKKYLMPLEVFQKKWDRDTLIISNKPIQEKSLEVQQADSQQAVQGNVTPLQAGGSCANCNAGGGNYQKNTTVKGDPVFINNMNLRVSERDLFISSVGPALEITRTYNAQMFSEIPGWIYEKGSGGWILEDGVYGGYGDITFTQKSWYNPTIIADVKTVTAGDSILEVGGITFCYTDEHNRYYFRIAKEGSNTYLFLGKKKNDIHSWLVDGWLAPFFLDPQDWNTIKIRYTNGNIKVYLRDQLVIDYTDAQPLSQGKVGLEAHFCYAQFDNVRIEDATQTQNYDFNESDEGQYIMGYGWEFTYGMRIKELDNCIIVYREDSRRDRYQKNGDGSLTAPALVYDILAKVEGGYQLRLKDGTVYRFDASGKLNSITDRNNNMLRLLYNATGQLTTVTDAVGRNLYFTYTPLGKIETITDPATRVFHYTYNSEGNLASVTDAKGYTTTYSYYPPSHLLHTITDPKGNTYTYSYFYNRRINQQIDPLGQVTTFDCLWDTTVVTNDKGDSYSYNFDEANDRLISETSPIGLQKRYTYYPQETLKNVTDRNSNHIFYTYDAWGNLLSRQVDGIYPETYTTTWTYEPAYHQVKTLTNPNGDTTTFNYDSNGNLIETIAPSPYNYKTRDEYYANGLLKAIYDANNNKWEYVYDGNGYIQKVIDPQGNENTMEYDILGNLLRITDARGNTTSFRYDLNDNLVKKIAPSPFNYEYNYDYDENNNLIHVVSADGARIEYVYDALDNLIEEKRFLRENEETKIYVVKYTYDTTDFMPQDVILRKTVTDANNNTTTYNYNKNHDLTEIIDPQGNITRYNYDNEGALTDVIDAFSRTTHSTLTGTEALVIKITYPDGTYEGFDYDKNGNLKSHTSRNGRMLIYEYDTLNRLTKKYESNNPSYLFTYTYDPVGNLLSATGPEGTTRYTYNKLNRLQNITYPSGEIIQYQYDAAGNLAQLIYPDASLVTYSYDALNRLADIKQAAETLVHYEYDALGRVTKRQYANGTEAVYQYDDLNRLTSLRNQHSTGASLINEYIYSYDANGNCLSVTTDEGQSRYVYDTNNQLLKFSAPDARTINYSFDKVGNRLRANDDGLIADYTYNQVNALTNLEYNSGLPAQNITVRGRIKEPNLDAVTVNGLLAYYDLQTQTFAAENIPISPGLNTITAVASDKVGHSSNDTIQIEVEDNSPFSFYYDNNGNLIRQEQGLKVLQYHYDIENHLLKVENSLKPLEPITYKYDSFGRRIKKESRDNQSSYFYDQNNQVIYEKTSSASYVWKEDFNPIQEGWQDDTDHPGWNCVVDGQGKVSVVSNYPVSWGHVYTPVITVDVTENPILTVDVSEVSSGANFTLEVQAYRHDNGRAEDIPGAIQQINPGTYSVNVAELMGWSGVHSYMVGIWVGGGQGGYIDLDRITVGKQNPLSSVKYIYGPHLDEILIMQRQGRRYYYHHDRLGSVVAITDNSAVLVERYKYDPYGKTKIFNPAGLLMPSSSISNTYAFTGRELDPETGLYYYRARWYSPAIGRFLQRDQWPTPLTDPSSLVNRYLYVNNNPINWVDPFGLDKQGTKPLWDEDSEKILNEIGGVVQFLFIDIWRESAKWSWRQAKIQFAPTPGRILRWSGGVLKQMGYKVGGKALGILGLVLEPGGTGKVTGIIVGGTLVAGAASFIPLPGATVAGGILGGMIGGWAGSYFDYPGAGQLNYNEWEGYNGRY